MIFTIEKRYRKDYIANSLDKNLFGQSNSNDRYDPLVVMKTAQGSLKREADINYIELLINEMYLEREKDRRRIILDDDNYWEPAEMKRTNDSTFDTDGDGKS